jgi:ABC-type transport system substrate-binding protein
MPYAGIVSPTAVAEEGETFAQHPVGTGPFMMAEWDPGVSLSLNRNSDYHWGPLDVENKDAPHIDQAVFKVIPDASTQLAAFQAGEADVIFINQPAHLAKLESDDSVQLTEAAIGAEIYLGFNAARPPFDDVLVRQALSHAVQKDDILQAALGGIGKVSCTPLASTLPGYDESLCNYELGFDPARSEALLVEAGYAKNADGNWEKDGEILAATLLSSTRAPNGDIAAMLQNQFAAIGVPVEIQLLDARAALGAATEGDYDMMVWRYGWNDADVLNIYLASDRIGSTNRSFYSNPDVDTLLSQAIHELDPDARAELYQEALKLIMADAPWQPLYEPLDVIAVSGDAQDVVIGPMGRVLLNDARVVKQ